MNTVESERGNLKSEIERNGDGKNEAVVSLPMLTVERSQKLDLLLHLIANIREALVVCGPDGIGKSKMLQLVLASKLDSWMVCKLTATHGMTFADIQNDLLKALQGETTSGTDDAEGELQRLLQQFRRDGQLLVLLLDDAGQLPPGILTNVCQFAETCPALRLVCSMTADRLHLMASSDPAVENCQVIEVPPLSENQCGEFLKQLSGLPGGAIPFKAVTLPLTRQVYLESHGVPGRIVALLPGIAKGRVLGVSANNLPGYGLAVFCIAVFAGYLLWNPAENGAPGLTEKSAGKAGFQPVKRVIDLPGMVEKKTLLERDANAESHEEKSAPEAGTGFVAATPNDKAGQVAIVETPVVADDAIGINAPDRFPDSDEHLVSARDRQPVDDDVSAALAVQRSTLETDNGVLSDKKPDSQSQSDRLADNSSTGAPGTAGMVSSDAGLTEDAPEKESIASDEAILARSQAIASDSGGKKGYKDRQPGRGVHGADWVLEQNPNKYTLQLLAVKNYASMQAFIDKNRELGKLAVFKTRKNSAQWYALIHGLYPSLRAAEDAAKKLPKGLQKSWPRKVKSVHKAIKSFGPQ